ncbi:TPA: alpha-glucan phosphorylase [Candidatus Sumerlaeota bacterium]|nr:alpha-glucan phosphorylase [Candidatus Sumerlaeota bacterium]
MKVNAYTVVPCLPEALKPLEKLAYNLRWSWDPSTLSLFQRLDRELWQESGHNPVRMLGTIKQERLNAVLQDDGFMAHLERASDDFDKYMGGVNWFKQTYGSSAALTVAYFSFEFGISEAVPIYSGGLGILAGDHIKSSSDLGLPIVGVSLLYREGYFRQYLNPDGWQQEIYPVNDFYNMPVRLLTDKDKKPLKVRVEFPGRIVTVQLWEMEVGRSKLLLMDANVPENTPEDRDMTAQLYGGDHEQRMRQEVLLGIGGIRALKAAGYKPDIYHMNEGHAAFLALERIRMIMEEQKVDFDVAAEAVRASNVFTTHTPVPAGNDSFSPATVDFYFHEFIRSLGIDMEKLLGLGRQNPYDRNEPFCMTVLALNHAAYSNGVSKLHGSVSRKMWQRVWPGTPLDEVPIGSITNGVHTSSWISQELGNLFDRYLGPDWSRNPSATALWNRADEIPDAELWRTHERRRERLVAFARKRLKKQLVQRGAPESEIMASDEVLDPDALTIGFARRFALYKRGTLLLRDATRLKKLLTDKDRPIQIIFAGKAHPADTMAKDIIRELVHFMRDPAIRRRVLFIEDYDMNVARYLMQGVDVWLNTPRRPLEASGTSGMKAAANGALNLSILDGWWCEGYAPNTGFAIGQGEEWEDLNQQDEIESAALYNILEKEVIPEFYDRAADGLPRAWIHRMKGAIQHLCAGFNANRMVNDYISGPYIGAASAGIKLAADSLAGAKELCEWKKRMRQNWNAVQLVDLKTPTDKEVLVGKELPIQATIRLGAIQPTEVRVEAYFGELNYKGEITNATAATLAFDSVSDGVCLFKGSITCSTSGRFGFGLRVLPAHESLVSQFESKLIYWA